MKKTHILYLYNYPSFSMYSKYSFPLGVIIVSIFLVIGFFHSVSADNLKTIQINTNFQTFLPLKNFSKITTLYHRGILQGEVISDVGIRLIERNRNLVFWYPIGTQSATGSLRVSLGEQKVFIPLELHIQKNDTDFSIAQDMFQLSLQKKSLSCESAAASDIISSFLGYSIDEDEIIEKLAKDQYYNTLPESHPGDTTIWGNPNTSFVGYMDHTSEIEAKQKLMTGYGVYEGPIAQIYNTYGFKTQIINTSSHNDFFSPKDQLTYILKQLQEGNMVQLWGDWCTREQYDDGLLDSKSDFISRNIGLSINAKNSCYNVDEERKISWKYYDTQGNLTQHDGLDGEHAFILLGWKGDIGNPTHIRVWDTDTAYHLYPIEEWMRKWAAMDYRSIIVLKKEQ